MPLQFVKSQLHNNIIDATKMDLSGGQTFDFTSTKITVATPVDGAEAATKAYVDAVAQGLFWHEPCDVATIGNITLSNTQTIDNVAVVAGDRVLVWQQTDAKTNGIYVVVSGGSWTRAADLDAGSEFPGAAVFILRGDTYDNAGFVCTNNVAPSLGSDNITFVQFTGAGQIVAGDGLSKVGNTLSVNLDQPATTGLTFNAGGLSIADGGLKLAKQGWKFGYEEFVTTGALTFTLSTVTQQTLPSGWRDYKNIQVYRNGQLQRGEAGTGQPSDDNGYRIQTSGSTDVQIVIKNGFALASGEVLQAHYVSN